MNNLKILESLFKYGIGEYYLLHIVNNKLFLGYIHFEKGRMLLKDEGLLGGIKPETFKPCWELGLIGMVCSANDKEWESLTFYGLDNCQLPQDLESTRHGFLVAAQNQYGEKLIDFAGSIYRGYDLMLHNHVLPVIILNKVTSKFGEVGLAVTDLRTAPMAIALIQKLHDNVRDQIDQKLTMDIIDSSIDNSDFQELFKDYLNQQKK